MNGFFAKLVLLAALPLATQAGTCSRFDAKNSTAYDPAAKKITLPWRTDYPASVPSHPPYSWESISFKTSWRRYTDAVLKDVRDSGISIDSAGKIRMPAGSPWWIAPWMDYGSNGRERVNGLTKERSPDPLDLSPTSPGGFDVWAIGWYNSEGAVGLGKVFADPCDPVLPARDAPGLKFPDKTVSFKMLFSNATGLDYLDGAPTVLAKIDKNSRAKRLKLLQVDIAIRDPDADETDWVMGTFIWKGPARGDGFLDNLVPVGLMWGNDPNVHDASWGAWAPIKQSRINKDLAGVLWQGTPGSWLHRPFPGFQGRLNGPADNMRSSCLSCHALAQWPRNPTLSIVPTYPVGPNGPQPPLSEADIEKNVSDYFRNTRGGDLVDPTFPARPLDYSLQLEAGLTRMCQACKEGKLLGPTPKLCNEAPTRYRVTAPACDLPLLRRVFMNRIEDDPPRQ